MSLPCPWFQDVKLKMAPSEMWTLTDFRWLQGVKKKENSKESQSGIQNEWIWIFFIYEIMKAYTFSIICLSIAFLTWILIEDFESADKKKNLYFI